MSKASRFIEEYNMVEKIKYVSISDSGIPLGLSDDGLFFLQLETKQGYFSMTSHVYAPVTEEQIREWEADAIESEADWYYEEVMGNEEGAWDKLSSKEQKEELEYMINNMVQSKLDNMSGSFDDTFRGTTMNYYLDMISAGQGDVKEVNKPFIPKAEIKVLGKAWKELHLKKMNDISVVGSPQAALLKSALDIYDRNVKKGEKFIEKGLQFWSLSQRGKKGKALDKILKKSLRKKPSVSKRHKKLKL